MKDKIREAAEVLKIYLDTVDCELCENVGKNGCICCENKEYWALSEKAADMLINKIENILVPKAHWVKYEDYDEYFCSNCEWPAPFDAYGKSRDLTRYCSVCGARMIDGDSLELTKEYEEILNEKSSGRY